MPGYPTRKLLLGGPETLTVAAELAILAMAILCVLFAQKGSQPRYSTTCPLESGEEDDGNNGHSRR